MICLFIYLLFHFYLSQDTKRMKTDIPYRNDKTVLDRSSPSKLKVKKYAKTYLGLPQHLRWNSLRY